MAGYHLKDIDRGELGELSKIQEELFELIDAEAQSNKIMMLAELSDLYGAMEHYLFNKFGSSFTMNDLEKMAKATQKAFSDGTRK